MIGRIARRKIHGGCDDGGASRKNREAAKARLHALLDVVELETKSKTQISYYEDCQYK